MAHHTDCKICGMLEAASPDDVVLAGDHWGVVAMQDVPGMFMAFTREHDGGVGSISDAAAAGMGPLIKSISQALVSTGQFEKVSVIYLGDNAIHTHFMLLGRKPADTPVFDNTPLLARFANKDRDKARLLVGHLRDVIKVAGLTR